MVKKLLGISAIAASLVMAAATTASATDLETARKFCNLATRDTLQAISNCTDLLASSNPTDQRDAYIQRCRAFLVHGWLEKALEDCNAALRLAPKSAVAYNNRAVVYRQLKRFPEALADHDRALSMDKKNDLYIRAKENTLKKMGAVG